MKRILPLVLCFAVLTSGAACLCSCGSEPSDETVSVSFYETDHITVNNYACRATYNDGIVSYSWQTDKWLFEYENGVPNLSTTVDGATVGFKIIAVNAGVADDFGLYARKGLTGFYGLDEDYVKTHTIAATEDSYFKTQGYFGVQTGFYDVSGDKENNPLGNTLAIVHAVTDGSNSALVCVYAKGGKIKLEKIYDSAFRANGYYPYLEIITADIINTFAFVSDETAPEDLPGAKAFFTYNDAYELFEDIYSWASHYEYCERVAAEVEKMKEKVVAVNAEIMEKMKNNYGVVTEIHPDAAYDDYYEKYVLPYVEYYNSRMQAAENVEDAYLGISTVMTYGGNVAGDCALLWEYAHYRNLYYELCNLRDFIY